MIVTRDRDAVRTTVAGLDKLIQPSRVTSVTREIELGVGRRLLTIDAPECLSVC